MIGIENGRHTCGHLGCRGEDKVVGQDPGGTCYRWRMDETWQSAQSSEGNRVGRVEKAMTVKDGDYHIRQSGRIRTAYHSRRHITSFNPQFW